MHPVLHMDLDFLIFGIIINGALSTCLKDCILKKRNRSQREDKVPGRVPKGPRIVVAEGESSAEVAWPSVASGIPQFVLHSCELCELKNIPSLS